MKVKIGTQLEEEVFQDLKMAAAREKKPISELIQVAVVTYLHQQKGPPGRKNGLARFLEKPPLTISDEDLREILEPQSDEP
jgi:hypothetical protein